MHGNDTIVVEKVRMNIEFPQHAVERIDEMRRLLGVPTRVEVIRRALGVYEWLLYEAKDGKPVNLDAAQVALAVGLSRSAVAASG